MKKIERLQVNHLYNPSGVTGKPVFSWISPATVQKSRRITVRCRDRLLWDSGLIKSREHLSIPYEGETLPSLERCTFTVEINSKHSASGSFITGCDDLSERVKWITAPDAIYHSSSVFHVEEGRENEERFSEKGLAEGIYLMREFDISKSIRSAYLAISGVGFYHVFINNLSPSASPLQPAQTDYRKRALYETYEITSSLHKGKNRILIVLGNGRYIEQFGYSGTPKAAALLKIRYKDGSEEEIITDESFLYASGPVKSNGIYEGTVYDQRDERLIFSPEHHAAAAPPIPLESSMLPPISEHYALKPVSIAYRTDGRWICDFGENSAGTYRIRLSERKGSIVRMRFSELLDENGNLHTLTQRRARIEDVFISAGRECVYQPMFTYHGFRYMEISGIDGILSADRIEKVVFSTANEKTGCFLTSDDLLQRIHDSIQRSQRSNVMGIPTDCPQREERMGWLGDVQLASEEAALNYDMAAFYIKFLDDIRLSQAEDGSLSDVTPPYWPLYPADPVWGSAYAELLWKVWSEYRDRTVLEKHFAPLKRYLSFLLSSRDEDGTLHRFGKYGDWCPPGCTTAKRTPVDLSSTWSLMKDLKTAADIADVLRRDEDKKELKQLFKEVKDAFLARFNHDGIFEYSKDSPKDRFGSMTSQILPLYLGIVPRKDIERALDVLITLIRENFDYHADCGILGIRYLFPVLKAYGYDDESTRIMRQKTYPSLGYMIEMGATTIWERWEYLAGMGMNSHNHIMYGSPDAWFFRTLAGIEEGDGLSLSPVFPDGIEYAEAETMLPDGPVKVFWLRKDEEVQLTARFPVSMELSFRSPAGWTEVKSKQGKGSYCITLKEKP